MINAVANSTVPHLTLILGASYGAGNYGMCRPGLRPPVPVHLADLQVGRDGPRAARRRHVDRQPGVGRARRAARSTTRPTAPCATPSATTIEAESLALFNTGRLYDDGIIDPRDTRTVLGIALSACHSGEVKGTAGFGVFRM